MTKWKFILISDVKGHIVPEPIYIQIKQNLLSRFPEKKLIKEKEISSCLIDLPGMIRMDRNIHEIDLGGLVVKIPSTDFTYFYNKLLELPPRKEVSTKYYKLHGTYVCLCLQMQHMGILLQEMKKMLPEAKAIAAIENQQFNESLKEINKHKNLLIGKRKEDKINEA